MTLRNSPLMLDGALTDSATVRTGIFAATGNAEGVTTGGALKVQPLSTPGVGFRIANGAGVALNRYQTAFEPNQVYVVANEGEHVVSAASMPPVAGVAKSHLVVIAVGDPEYSAEGHPFMGPDDPPAGTEATFQYVRPVIIQDVPAGTTDFAQLNLHYPAVTLARLDVPAGASTITSGMIVDLRTLPQPKVMVVQEHIQNGNTADGLTGQGNTPGQYELWPVGAFVDVKVPAWATVLKASGFVEGVSLSKAGNGTMRIAFVDGGATTTTNMNESAPSSGADRKAYNIGGKINIPAAYRGTTRRIRIEATPGNSASQNFLTTNGGTSAMLNLRFEEGLT